MSPLTMGREENLGFTEKILRDAAAVAAMRERIEKMVPKKIKEKKDWKTKHLIEILLIFNDLLRDTLSEIEPNDQDDVTILLLHPAYSLVNEFILALRDQEKGIPTENLEIPTNIAGNSFNALEEKNIQHAMFLINLFQFAQGVTAKQARIMASKQLASYGMKTRGKEMTPNRLKEWSKTYDLNGRKKRGK